MSCEKITGAKVRGWRVGVSQPARVARCGAASSEDPSAGSPRAAPLRPPRWHQAGGANCQAMLRCENGFWEFRNLGILESWNLGILESWNLKHRGIHGQFCVYVGASATVSRTLVGGLPPGAFGGVRGAGRALPSSQETKPTMQISNVHKTIRFHNGFAQEF